MPTNPPDQSKLFTLYGLKRPDDNVIRYIGITCQRLPARLSGHISDASKKKYHKDFWVSKMAPLRPEIISYAVELSLEEACELERFVIQELRKTRPSLTNISDGGTAPMLGRKHTQEAREAMSVARTGDKHPMFGKCRSGEKNPMFGKRHSPETREILRRKALERPAEVREEFSLARKGLAPWNKGKSMSLEAREKMSGENHPMFGKVPWNKGVKGQVPWNKGLKKI